MMEVHTQGQCLNPGARPVTVPLTTVGEAAAFAQRNNVRAIGQRADPKLAVYGEVRLLAVAQQALDEHVSSSVTGRCLGCGAAGPCLRRETAMAVFSRSRWLPRRVPGLSQPERLGLRRVDLAKAAFGIDRPSLFGVRDA